MPQRYGVTGTQTPGPDAELLVRQFLYDHNLVCPDIEMVVGCCIGMDTTVGLIAHELGISVHGVLPAPRYKVDPRYKMYCTSVEEVAWVPGKSDGWQFMNRNDRLVVIATLGFVGFPKTAQEELRSGTWATIRRARRKFGDIPIIPVGDA